MASPPSSPTLCRPQHIDRERVRAALRSAAATDAANASLDDDVLFHEAVVAASPPRRPRAIQLLALTRDAVLLLPLSSATSGCQVTRLSLARVESFERVTAVDAARRSLLLVPTSELYLLRVRDCDGGGDTITDVWISSFEPETRVFAHVARARRVHFQSRLQRPRNGDEVAEDDEDVALELSDRLEALLADLVELLPAFDGLDSDDRYRQSTQLLLELVAGFSCSPSLQRLVLANKTRLTVGWTRGSGGYQVAIGESVTVGLPALLVQVLEALAASPHGSEMPASASEGRLELAGSVARVLAALLFDSLWLRPEREVFLRSVHVSELVRQLQGAALACYESSAAQERGEAWHVLWEELLDAQAALLLELDDVVACEMQLVAAAESPESLGVAAMLVRTTGFWWWIEKLFKRICVSVASIERHAPMLLQGESNSDGDDDGDDDEDEGDDEDEDGLTVRRRAAQLWSLALWRNVALLDLLVAHSRDAVVTHLRDQRRDYIDFYLRSARFLSAMRGVGAQHVVDTAQRLEGLVAAVDAAG